MPFFAIFCVYGASPDNKAAVPSLIWHCCFIVNYEVLFRYRCISARTRLPEYTSWE